MSESANRAHLWTEEPGGWSCPRCGAVCDQNEPCSKHGTCIPKNRKTYESPYGIEQSRRDFKRDYPELYRYIALREAAKALDSAGDHISGHHEAANKVWALAAQHTAQWRGMLDG